MPGRTVASIQKETTELLERIGAASTARRVLLQGVDADGSTTHCYTPDGHEVEATDADYVFQVVAEMLPALLSDRRYAGLASGRSAGKSHGIARWILAIALTESRRILVPRETLMSLSESMYALLRDLVLGDDYLSTVFDVMRDRLVCVITGAEVLFKGLRRDRVESSIKSIERIKYAVVEEAQTISQVSLRVLRPSIRDDDSRILFLINRRYVDDSVDEEFIQRERANTEVVHFTYRDNYWCPAVMLEEASTDYKTNPNPFNHVWLGELATQADELVVADNWLIEEFSEDDVVREAKSAVKIDPYLTSSEKRHRYAAKLRRIEDSFYVGGDHGWVDPTAFIEVYYDAPTKRSFVIRELYERRMKLETIAPKLQEAIPRTAD